MILRTLYKISFAMFVVVTFASLWFIQPTALAHPPMDATPVGDELRNPKFLKDPCPADPNNLLQNAAMDPGGNTQYGSVADVWQPFIFNGSPPQFRWVNNEGIYRGQSQQIFSSGPFDAGIYQVVSNLTPNNYYWFRLGWAPAAKSYSGPNVESNGVGRKVGVDPFGGTDPKSPNVIWGPDYFGDTKGLNRNQLTLFFPARAASVTIFMRALATDGAGGENRVWFNAPCMEARPDVPAAAPLQPTATSTPLATATRTATPRPAATRIILAPTNTPTAIPADIRAPDTATPTVAVAFVAAPSATPRFARPAATPVPGSSIDFGTGIFIGVGFILVMSALLFFGIGFIWWHKTR